MTQEWKQERPTWCPHADCLFRRRAMDDICGGQLPEPVLHEETPNTHRFCLNGADSTGAVFDLQVNGSDLEWMRWIFDALDGRNSTWLSQGPIGRRITERKLAEDNAFTAFRGKEGDPDGD